MPRRFRIKFSQGSSQGPFTFTCETGRFALSGKSANFLPLIGEQPPSELVTQYVLFDGPSGANSRFFNGKISESWTNANGDWLDSIQASNGTSPWSTFTVAPGFVGWISVPIPINLINRWRLANRGICLVVTGGSDWTTYVAGRTYSNTGLVPRLEVTTNVGGFVCPVTATCTLDGSTSMWVDGRTTFGIQRASKNALLQFNISSASGVVSSATMYLYVIGGPQSGTASIDVYEINPPRVKIGADGESPVLGIAAGYVNDVGIASHPSVLFSTSFPNDSSYASGANGSWDIGYAGQSSVVSRGYDASTGTYYLRSGFDTEPANDTSLYGGDLGRVLATAVNASTTKPTPVVGELYFRYYVFLENDWGDSPDGEIAASGYSGYKMPGIDGRFGIWSSRDVSEYRLGGFYNAVSGNGAGAVSGLYEYDGTKYYHNGWSMRGKGIGTYDDGNPYDHTFSIGLYVYDMDKVAANGEDVWFGRNLVRGRWYCIEHYCKVNTLSPPYDPFGNGTANYDGEYKVWLDGVNVYDSTVTNPRPNGLSPYGWRWTRNASFKIAGPWLDWYHGGTYPDSRPEKRQHYRMNHIVCATQYIGPRSALLPSWVPAAGELKNISGDIAQTFDSQVASWYADDLLSARKMLTDFSGKCFNPYFGAYGAVLAHGGGHSATNDNSVYAFDLNDLKWKRISTPTNFGGTGQNQRNVGPVGTNQVNVTTGEYTVDNQAASFHSYDQMELIPPGSPGLGYGTFGGLMTVLRGAVQVHWSGNIKCAHVLRINSLSTPGTWERHSTGNDARTWNEGYGYSTAYDSDRGVIWYTSAANATNDRIALYDVGSTNYLFTYNIPAGHRLAADSNSGSMRYDKVHEALIHTGNGVSGVLIDYMLCNSPGAGWTPAPLSASIPSTGAYQQCPMCYVPERNVWLLITAADPTVVYEIAIPQNITQTWTVTTRGLTGVTSMPWTNSFFSKGWMYNERLKCITIIIDHQTIYAYRPWGT